MGLMRYEWLLPLIIFFLRENAIDGLQKASLWIYIFDNQIVTLVYAKKSGSIRSLEAGRGGPRQKLSGSNLENPIFARIS